MISRTYCVAALCLGCATLATFADAIAIRGNLKIKTNPDVVKDSTSLEENCGGAGLSFTDFMQKHGRTYVIGSKEYNDRKALFDERAAEIRSQNCRPRKLWTAGVNFLSDRTVDELARLRGRKGNWAESMQPKSGGDSAARERLVTLEKKAAAISRRDSTSHPEARKLPTSFDWKDLHSMNEIVDQGQCGSCWASATVKMLEAHAEIYQGARRKFALQQIVSCAPNPQECGGNGGCNGSTGELALDYVMWNGLGDDSDFPYLDKDEDCPTRYIANNPYPVPQPNHSSLLAISTVEYDGPAREFGMIGWSKLPANELNPLFLALYQEGPIAVSVVAGQSWNMYESGIMDNCTDKDFIVNHLVVLIGYGEDTAQDNTKYWTIQNSWSSTWGEGGHIRMIRQDYLEEESLCGVDDNPAIGTGCKGGPSEVWVCGSCGVLYDNVVPHFEGDTTRAQEMAMRRAQHYTAEDI